MSKLNSEQSHSLGQKWKEQRMMQEAMLGDIAWTVSPATVTTAPTSEAWTRTVEITATNTAGEVHDWVDTTITSGVSIADTSSAGTASIPSTTLTLVNGRGSVVVSGDAQDWLGGTAQIESITVTGAPTADGDITIQVTAAGMTNSPKDVFPG